MCSDPVVSIRGLGKAYQTYVRPSHRLMQFILPRFQRWLGRVPGNYYTDFWALQDIDLDVFPGEAVAIVGRNGSGKSTLLQMVAGTLSPTAGSAAVHGRIAALLELGSGFNQEFTGRENVYMNGALLGLSQDEITARMDEIIEFSGIGQFIDQPLRTYSSGMVVRLAFSVSTCVTPDILIIDEALSVGDSAFQFKCLERLRALREAGTTLLFVSHDMGMVKAFCTRAIYLERGREKMSGTPDQVVEQYYMDLRDEQRRNLSGLPVIKKNALGDHERSTAFGTEQGSITAAAFAAGRSKEVIQGGDSLRFSVEVAFEPALKGASLSVVLLERRMIDIGGMFFPVDGVMGSDGKMHGVVEVDFLADLCPGEYFLTLRLESREETGWFFPVDKQVAALSFEVMPYVPDFVGISRMKFSRVG